MNEQINAQNVEINEHSRKNSDYKVKNMNAEAIKREL